MTALLLHVVRLKVTPVGRTSRLPDDAIVRGVRVPLDCDSPAIPSLGSRSPFLCCFLVADGPVSLSPSCRSAFVWCFSHWILRFAGRDTVVLLVIAFW